MSQVITFDATALLLDAATTLTRLAQGKASPPSADSMAETSTTAAVTSQDSNEQDQAATIVSPRASFSLDASIPKWKCSFPLQLMEILNDEQYTECLAWLPHGRSFAILQPNALMKNVLPKYMPHPVNAVPKSPPKYVSFTRKLHRWGFRQETRGADVGAFTHPLFRRDQPELCLDMMCDRKGTVQKNEASNKGRSPVGPRRVSVAVPTPRVLVQKQTSPFGVPKPTSPLTNALPVKPSCPTRHAVSDDSDDAQSTKSMTAMQTITNLSMAPLPLPLPFPVPLPARNAAAQAMAQHNVPLTRHVLERRNEMERLEVARLLLFQNYLQAMHSSGTH